MQRGLRFLERRLRPEMTLSLANQMYQGVSSAFVRDIVHFHCTMSERALAGVERMSDADFVLQQPSLTRSACDLLVEQIADEIELLEQLAPDNSSRPAAAESEAPPTKANLCHQLRSLHTLLRMHVSNLTDNACNAKADGVNAYVWELFMQLLHNGIERRVLLRMALAQAGIPLETESFIPFFRPDAEPARADKRPQELALVASH